MIYRMRIYEGVRPDVAVFNSFFEQHLLPVQVRHGARLVGRWQTEDERIVAVWEYDSRECYEQIQAAVRRDQDSVKAQGTSQNASESVSLDAGDIHGIDGDLK